jgi:protein-disulfide isomerase
MTNGWKFAALGALGGAALAVVIVIGLAARGLLPAPNNDAAIHAYLMDHPSILVDMTNKLQADQSDDDDKARQAAVDKLGMKPFFDPRVAFVTGPADAKTTLVEFYDYDCPYCRASLPAVRKYYAAHKNDTRFAFIEFPIPSLHGAGAVLAARASLAARRQPGKFVAFSFALMGADGALTADIIYADAKKAGLNVERLKKDMNDGSVSAALNAAHDLALAAKVDGTPAFIVNGRMHEGALDDTLLNQLTKQHV